ncbi:MAG: SH3-like domain-containing protein [Actinomycetota bacterium]
MHDMGGMQGFGAVVVPDGDLVFHAAWEARQCATSLLTALDRRVIENMPAHAYLAAGYYERWMHATEQVLLDEGKIEPGEIEDWQRRLASGEATPVRSDPDLVAREIASLRKTWRFAAVEDPRFDQGDRVRVRPSRPSGHTRCPRYVRGVLGTVRTILGADQVPDAPDDPSEPVYSVAFASADLWGASAEGDWTVIVDLWERYLEPTEATDG